MLRLYLIVKLRKPIMNKPTHLLYSFQLEPYMKISGCGLRTNNIKFTCAPSEVTCKRCLKSMIHLTKWQQEMIEKSNETIANLSKAIERSKRMKIYIKVK